MILTEYDEELHIRSEKQLSFEEGEARGMERGRKEGICAFIEDNLEEGVARGRILEKLQKRFALSAAQANGYLERFTPG